MRFFALSGNGYEAKQLNNQSKKCHRCLADTMKEVYQPFILFAKGDNEDLELRVWGCSKCGLESLFLPKNDGGGAAE